jgi:hypothetical protein
MSAQPTLVNYVVLAVPRFRDPNEPIAVYQAVNTQQAVDMFIDNVALYTRLGQCHMNEYLDRLELWEVDIAPSRVYDVSFDDDGKPTITED